MCLASFVKSKISPTTLLSWLLPRTLQFGKLVTYREERGDCTHSCIKLCSTQSCITVWSPTLWAASPDSYVFLHRLLESRTADIARQIYSLQQARWQALRAGGMNGSFYGRSNSPVCWAAPKPRFPPILFLVIITISELAPMKTTYSTSTKEIGYLFSLLLE